MIFKKIDKYFDGALTGKTFAVWGLSFKPNTDDVRFAPAFVLIESLLNAGAKVKVFDPVAMNEAKKQLGDSVEWSNDVYKTVEDADAIALITEWNEFRLPDWQRIQSLMKGKAIFDGRNIYDDVQLQKAGFDYFGIGV